jgi:hypothetical protein
MKRFLLALFLLLIAPLPALALGPVITPSNTDFGDVYSGNSKQNHVLINVSGGTIHIDSIGELEGTNPGDFTIDDASNCVGQDVQFHCSILVTFSPQGFFGRSATFKIHVTVGTGEADLVVTLTGNGTGCGDGIVQILNHEHCDPENINGTECCGEDCQPLANSHGTACVQNGGCKTGGTCFEGNCQGGSNATDGGDCDGTTCSSGVCGDGDAVTCASPKVCHQEGVCNPVGDCTFTVSDEGSTCETTGTCDASGNCEGGSTTSGTTTSGTTTSGTTTSGTTTSGTTTSGTTTSGTTTSGTTTSGTTTSGTTTGTGTTTGGGSTTSGSTSGGNGVNNNGSCSLSTQSSDVSAIAVWSGIFAAVAGMVVQRRRRS